MRNTGNILSTLALAALLGGMLFFATVMMPTVFARLPPGIAAPFLHTAFPRYYAYASICTAVAAAGFLLRRHYLSVALLLLVLALLIWSWVWQLPQLDAMRAAGDTAGFDRGHTISLWLYTVEFLAAAGLLVKDAIR